MKLIKVLGVIFVLLLPVVIFGNPKYVELNDLAIIRGVGISCGEEVNLYFQEIIPVKSDNGISYQYEYYQSSGKNINTAFQKMRLKTKKKLYLSKVGFLVTDCTKSNKAIKQFELENIKIYHVQADVFNRLKKIKE